MIVSIGELLADLVTTTPVNNLAEARLLEVKPGGSPANFAAYCHKLGMPVTLVSAVGDDGLGKLLLGHATRLGFSSTHIYQLPNHATSLIIIGSNGQTPEFVAYRDADCHIPPIAESLVAGCHLLHSTAFALSRAPAQQNILAAMQQAAAMGKPVSVDWNYSAKIWGADNNAQLVFEQVMALQPLLKLSMDDVHRFWGEHLRIEEAMNRVNAYRTTTACITCGAAGVWFRLADGSWQHRQAKPIKVIDPTGAGDSFWSGFVTSFLKGLSITDCITAALETASLKLQDKL